MAGGRWYLSEGSVLGVAFNTWCQNYRELAISCKELTQLWCIVTLCDYHVHKNFWILRNSVNCLQQRKKMGISMTDCMRCFFFEGGVYFVGG